MKWLAGLFFCAYAATLLIAGAWGACFARSDAQFLLHLDVRTLDHRTAASLLSQYRFLRAIECGFGLFSIVFRREIFVRDTFNRIFLATMAAGVIARLISLVVDGKPGAVFYLFAGYEIIGVFIISAYSRTVLEP